MMRSEAEEGSIWDQLLDHPIAQAVMGAMGARVDGVIGRLEQKVDIVAKLVMAQAQAQQHRAHQGAQPQQPPPPARDPRVVMGFPPGHKLTPEMIKERKRELAKIYHSDRGGNTEAMQDINAAADELLREVSA